MKKLLILSGAFVAMIVLTAPSVDVFAADYDGRSVEVTVGEVDRIDTGDRDGIDDIDEKQRINAPDTGLFGLGVADGASVMSATFLIAFVIIIVWLLLKATVVKKKF